MFPVLATPFLSFCVTGAPRGPQQLPQHRLYKTRSTKHRGSHYNTPKCKLQHQKRSSLSKVEFPRLLAYCETA